MNIHDKRINKIQIHCQKKTYDIFKYSLPKEHRIFILRYYQNAHTNIAERTQVINSIHLLPLE